MNEMQRWLRNYERLRVNPDTPNELWASSKYATHNMTWQEVSGIFISELDMTFGAAINSLKKLWKSYKIAGRNGEFRGDTAWKITQIQDALGIEKSIFPELEGMDVYDQEQEQLTAEVRLQEAEEVLLIEIGRMAKNCQKKIIHMPRIIG